MWNFYFLIKYHLLNVNSGSKPHKTPAAQQKHFMELLFMYQKLIFTITIILALFIGEISNATNTTNATKPTAKPVTTTQTTKATSKTTAKSAQSEDEKYAQVYEKCTKEAEGNEAKYDQLFNSCMEKNGFPQEEYETGGQPMQGSEQDN